MAAFVVMVRSIAAVDVAYWLQFKIDHGWRIDQDHTKLWSKPCHLS